jgi:hypothetical protein
MAWTSASKAKGANAMHAKYGAGHLTQKMLLADRANLRKGRMMKKHSGARLHRISPKSRGTAAARQAGSIVHLRSKAPLGTRRVAFRQTVILKVRQPTGRFRKFNKRISPAAYGERTGWRRARSHHFKKVLKPRKIRKKHLSHFRYRGGRITPR